MMVCTEAPRLKSPYPFFGGKSRIAAAVWERLGDVRGYVEPFAGSLACLLARPEPFDGSETVNDMDGLICNFWRALQADPKAVAEYADWPVNENDLHARHIWLVERKERLQERLEGDPRFYDAKAAGWWVWGLACWIGSEFCSGKGPWRVVKRDGIRQLVHLSDAGRGVNRKLVHLGDAGRGVKRQRVHLGPARGTVRKLEPMEGNAGLGERGLLEWMQALAERLQRARVCCGDWRRVCGGRSGNAIRHFFSSGKNGPCGIFLDPPYSAEANRDSAIYSCEDLNVAHDVRDWCMAHGDDPRLRIALCGYAGEGHEQLKRHGWTMLKWKAHGGMAFVGKNGDGQGRKNKHREVIWFSPHCLKPARRRAA